MSAPKMTAADAAAAYLKHQAYMKAYNKRPYVKSKRTSYNKARWQMIKAAGETLREEGLDDKS